MDSGDILFDVSRGGMRAEALKRVAEIRRKTGRGYSTSGFQLRESEFKGYRLEP